MTDTNNIELKMCTGKNSCGQLKPLSNFKLYESGTYSGQCLECDHKYHSEYSKNWEKEHHEQRKAEKKQYREDRKEEIKVVSKQYYETNKEYIRLKRKERYQNNKEYVLQQCKEYQQTHREEINLRQKLRRDNDIIYRLRKCISASIWRALITNSGSKNGGSILQSLLYTIPELKAHIEKQFSSPENLTPDGKVWMTWNNWGVYDPLTYHTNPTWQIDHIIPQSDLPFDSMRHLNFFKCWALSNLRPLDAKINHDDGVKRMRHQINFIRDIQ